MRWFLVLGFAVTAAAASAKPNWMFTCDGEDATGGRFCEQLVERVKKKTEARYTFIDQPQLPAVTTLCMLRADATRPGHVRGMCANRVETAERSVKLPIRNVFLRDVEAGILADMEIREADYQAGKHLK